MIVITPEQLEFILSVSSKREFSDSIREALVLRYVENYSIASSCSVAVVTHAGLDRAIKRIEKFHNGAVKNYG